MTPKENFLNQSVMDLALFFFTAGAQDALRTISRKRAIERFTKRFGHVCEDCSERSLMDRIIRMESRYNETLKSDETGFQG